MWPIYRRAIRSFLNYIIPILIVSLILTILVSFFRQGELDRLGFFVEVVAIQLGLIALVQVVGVISGHVYVNNAKAKYMTDSNLVVSVVMQHGISTVEAIGEVAKKHGIEFRASAALYHNTKLHMSTHWHDAAAEIYSRWQPEFAFKVVDAMKYHNLHQLDNSGWTKEEFETWFKQKEDEKTAEAEARIALREKIGSYRRY